MAIFCYIFGSSKWEVISIFYLRNHYLKYTKSSSSDSFDINGSSKWEIRQLNILQFLHMMYKHDTFGATIN